MGKGIVHTDQGCTGAAGNRSDNMTSQLHHAIEVPVAAVRDAALVKHSQHGCFSKNRTGGGLLPLQLCRIPCNMLYRHRRHSLPNADKHCVCISLSMLPHRRIDPVMETIDMIVTIQGGEAGTTRAKVVCVYKHCTFIECSARFVIPWPGLFCQTHTVTHSARTSMSVCRLAYKVRSPTLDVRL